MRAPASTHPAISTLVSLALVLTLSCHDRPEPTSLGDDPGPPGTGAASLAITCSADVARLQVSCTTPQSRSGAGSPLFLVVGGQGAFVTLEADPSAVSYDPATEIFEADVTVQNLIGQSLGTPDGKTVTGVRVFFHTGPAVKEEYEGTVELANPDGYGDFTGTHQAYFQYDQVLAAGSPPPPASGQKSQAKTWRFNASPNIEFTFSVFVDADVAYPDGWVDVNPNTVSVDVGQSHTGGAVVRDVVGRDVSGRAVTWSSDNPTVVIVDPGTGEMTGLALGSTEVCAASDGPEAQGCVLVEVVPQIFWDTIPGEISASGEVDEVTFEGVEGMEVSLFLLTLTGSLFDNLEACLIIDAGTFDEATLACLRSDGADTSLWAQSTGRTSLPRTTTYTVRVAGVGGDVGAYELQVFLLNRTPEVGPSRVVFGDTIDVEAIAPPGDVDEYTFLGNAGQEVAATLQTLSGDLLNGLQICLIADIRTANEEVLGCVSSDGADATLWGQSTERLTLPRATTYTFRVWAPDAQSDTDWGDYRYLASLIDRWPEVAARDVVFEDTVDVESIGPPGDVDEFVFFAQSGEEVAATLQTLSGDFTNALQLCVIADARTLDELVLGCTTSDGDDTSVWGQSTERLQLARTTAYTVEVLAPGAQSDTDWGPFRYMVHLIDRAPEVAPPGVVFGDTIDTEAIEPPGDVDDFTFEGSVGDEVVGFLQTLTGDFTNGLQLCVIADAGTLDELVEGCTVSDGNDTSLWGQNTGRLTLQRTTIYTVRVLAPSTQSDTDWGDYRYMVLLVDRDPESIPSAIAINDTIAGESIEPPGDIDEFTFQGTGGSSATLFCQAFDGGLFERLQFQLLANAGTGAEEVLGSCISDGTDVDLEGQSTGPIPLPMSATYTVRVLGVSDEVGLGSYRFHLRQ